MVVYKHPSGAKWCSMFLKSLLDVVKQTAGTNSHHMHTTFTCKNVLARDIHVYCIISVASQLAAA